ncbi:hypothetical protein TYRP_023765 [Tyrophagus putrescentiae]|nr:hypothetical protein TYRP_023765 [Tyrophagus putrescentiae]
MVEAATTTKLSKEGSKRGWKPTVRRERRWPAMIIGDKVEQAMVADLAPKPKLLGERQAVGDLGGWVVSELGLSDTVWSPKEEEEAVVVVTGISILKSENQIFQDTI